MLCPLERKRKGFFQPTVGAISKSTSVDSQEPGDSFQCDPGGGDTVGM